MKNRNIKYSIHVSSFVKINFIAYWRKERKWLPEKDKCYKNKSWTSLFKKKLGMPTDYKVNVSKSTFNT